MTVENDSPDDETLQVATQIFALDTNGAITIPLGDTRELRVMRQVTDDETEVRCDPAVELARWDEWDDDEPEWRNGARRTVPAPTRTASLSARRRWASARASSPVIHRLVPSAAAIRPSSVAASLGAKLRARSWSRARTTFSATLARPRESSRLMDREARGELLQMMGLVAAIVAVVILVFFGLGYVFGRLFL